MPPAKTAAEDSHGIRGCCFAYQNNGKRVRCDTHLGDLHDICHLPSIRRLKGPIIYRHARSPTENRCADTNTDRYRLLSNLFQRILSIS